jgi:hypothetical protein
MRLVCNPGSRLLLEGSVTINDEGHVLVDGRPLGELLLANYAYDPGDRVLGPQRLVIEAVPARLVATG